MLKRKIIKNLFLVTISSCLLSSCQKPMKGVLFLNVLDYSSYNEMCNDWADQNEYIYEEAPCSYNFSIPGADVSYHLSGIDYTDGYIMKGEKIPSRKRILGDRNMYILNRINRKNFYLFFPYVKGSENVDMDYFWELVGYTEHNSFTFTSNKSSRERIPFIRGEMSVEVDYFYALTNSNQDRFVYVAFQTPLAATFEEYKTTIENSIREIIYA